MTLLRTLCSGASIAAFALSAVGGTSVTAPARVTKSDASWAAVQDMHVARNGHSATRLLDGRVLIAGGRVGCCSRGLTSAEIFDPVANAWTDAHDMPSTNASAGVLLSDGRVLFMSEADGTLHLGVEIYDPASDAWTTARGPGLQGGFTLTPLPSGKVLIAGGFSDLATDALDTAALFDPVTSTWTPTGRLNDKRGGATATLLHDGRVLVFAGEVPTGNIELPTLVTTAELYDPATQTWTRTTSPNRAYTLPSATTLPDGRVLVLGDVGDTEVYDPATARWTIGATRQGEQGPYAFASLQTGQVLATGGSDVRLGRHYLGGVERYDPDRATWSPAASLLTPRFLHTATPLLDGRVLVAGGVGAGPDREVTLAKVEVYQDAVAIGPAFTGMWYDPTQNGHGLLVEVLPGARLLAAWFTFDPAGNPAWFLGVGAYGGNTATITAVDQPTGGRWIPNFDASRIVHNAWGTLTLTFSDCNHGVVHFSSTAGYGSGSMALTRLTAPAGLACP